MKRSYFAIRRMMSTSTSLELEVRPLEAMPGPKSLPLIGGIWKYFPIIGNYNINRLDLIGFSMQKEFGNVVKENLPGGQALVNVFDPTDIEKVYKAEGKFPARKSHTALEHYRLSRPELYNNGGILPTNGNEWWRLRSAFQKSLARVHDVRLFLPMADKIIGEFLNFFIGKETLITDFLPVVSRLNLELIWQVLFGTRLSGDNFTKAESNIVATQIIEATESANSCILPTEMMEGIWKIYKTPTYKKLEKNLHFLESVAEEQLMLAIKKADQFTKSAEDSVTLLNNYLQIKEVDIKDVRGMVGDLILGGIDTTSYTACFLMHHLSKDKRVQELLRNEALKLLPNIDSPVTSSVLNEAIYTRAVLKESFRLNPIATGVSRILNKDAVLSGYLVPKGTIIITQNLVACRSEKNFVNPAMFLPERWIRGSADYCNVTPYLVLPFSHGPRTCIARRLAEQNLLTLLLKIGREYSLEWKGNQLDVVTPLICKPDRDVRIAFKSW